MGYLRSHILKITKYVHLYNPKWKRCLHEIKKLKAEASSSFANETISSLQKENDTLKERLNELESRHTSMKQDAATLVDLSKSLMTAIRLLNNKLWTVSKADNVRFSHLNTRPHKKEWQVIGAKRKKGKKNQNKGKKSRKQQRQEKILRIL